MFASAGKALGVIFHPAFRGVLLKSLLLTVLLFALVLFGAEYGLSRIPPLHWAWLNTAIEVLGSLLLAAVLVLFGPAVMALFASLFLDDIAAAVEREAYPADAPSAGIPFWRGLSAGARLTVLVVTATLLLLPADIELPGIGEVLTLAVDGWILGREFFELAALRHLTPQQAAILRREHAAAIWAGGLLLALLAMIPVVNFFAPLYGAAFMVHLFKRYEQRMRLA